MRGRGKPTSGPLDDVTTKAGGAAAATALATTTAGVLVQLAAAPHQSTGVRSSDHPPVVLEDHPHVAPVDEACRPFEEAGDDARRATSRRADQREVRATTGSIDRIE